MRSWISWITITFLGMLAHTACGNDVPSGLVLCENDADCTPSQRCVQRVCVSLSGGSSVTPPKEQPSTTEENTEPLLPSVETVDIESLTPNDQENLTQDSLPEEMDLVDTENLSSDPSQETDLPEPLAEDEPVTLPEPSPEKVTEPGREPAEEPVAEDASGPEPPPPPDVECQTGHIRACYTGPAGTINVGICRAGQQSCVGGKWSTCQGQVLPATTENCADALDNNCNGKINEGCPCNYLGIRVGVCKDGTLDGVGNCLAPAKYNKIDLCSDGLDNNCSGAADEFCPCLFGGKSQGVCANAKTNSSGICQAPDGYSTTEICDGKDNNCDGQVDEGNPGGGTTCIYTAGIGECKNGTLTCLNGILQCRPGLSREEVCDGKDNNCDGLVDNLKLVACWVILNKYCRYGKYVCDNKTNQKVCDANLNSTIQLCSGTSVGTCNGACPAPPTGSRFVCENNLCKVVP